MWAPLRIPPGPWSKADGFDRTRSGMDFPEGGEESVPLEVTANATPGQVVLPHGLGLVHQGVKHGANASRLTGSTRRDRLAPTPCHRFVTCRVEPVTADTVG